LSNPGGSVQSYKKFLKKETEEDKKNWLADGRKYKKVIIEDENQNTHTLTTYKDRSTLIGKCPFHQHFRSNFQINPYEMTYFCKDCEKKGKVMSISDLAEIPQEEPIPMEYKGIGELALEEVNKLGGKQ
jgi:hypothetical protein